MSFQSLLQQHYDATMEFVMSASSPFAFRNFPQSPELQEVWGTYSPEQKQLISAFCRAATGAGTVEVCLQFEQPDSEFALTVSGDQLAAGHALAVTAGLANDLPEDLLES